MKALKLIVLSLVALTLVGVLSRNQLIKMEARRLLAEQTGFGLEIGRLKTHLLSSRAELLDVVVRNPPDFPESTAFVIKRVFVDIDPWALFRRETHVTSMELEISRVVIVRNREGEINLQRLSGKSSSSASGPPKGSPTPPPGAPKPSPSDSPPAPATEKPERPFRVDRLRLKIGAIEYHDYRGGGDPSITQLDLKVDREHTNITSTRDIGNLVMAGVMESAAERLFGDLGRSLQKAVEDEKLREEVKKFGRDLKRAFKGLMGESAQE